MAATRNAHLRPRRSNFKLEAQSAPSMAKRLSVERSHEHLQLRVGQLERVLDQHPGAGIDPNAASEVAAVDGGIEGVRLGRLRDLERGDITGDALVRPMSSSADVVPLGRCPWCPTSYSLGVLFRRRRARSPRDTGRVRPWLRSSPDRTSSGASTGAPGPWRVGRVRPQARLPLGA